jgi:hypothetical protein
MTISQCRSTRFACSKRPFLRVYRKTRTSLCILWYGRCLTRITCALKIVQTGLRPSRRCKVVHILESPGAYPNVPVSAQPLPLDKDPLEHSQRSRIPPPLTCQDFPSDGPDLIGDAVRRDVNDWKLCEAPKPLHIVQPDSWKH